MIEKQEISELARELSLDLHVVEKDYVLGWLLAGIAANPELSEVWADGQSVRHFSALCSLKISTDPSAVARAHCLTAMNLMDCGSM